MYDECIAYISFRILGIGMGATQHQAVQRRSFQSDHYGRVVRGRRRFRFGAESGDKRSVNNNLRYYLYNYLIAKINKFFLKQPFLGLVHQCIAMSGSSTGGWAVHRHGTPQWDMSNIVSFFVVSNSHIFSIYGRIYAMQQGDL